MAVSLSGLRSAWQELAKATLESPLPDNDEGFSSLARHLKMTRPELLLTVPQIEAGLRFASASPQGGYDDHAWCLLKDLSDSVHRTRVPDTEDFAHNRGGRSSWELLAEMTGAQLSRYSSHLIQQHEKMNMTLEQVADGLRFAAGAKKGFFLTARARLSGSGA